MEWNNLQGIPALTYVCGYCGDKVASKEGYSGLDRAGGGKKQAFLYTCPGCTKPSFLYDGQQVPGVAPGSEVAHLPPEIEALYREARTASGAGACTAAVLACRKLLMNIAVAQGAKAGESFVSYVDYLAKAGYVPPNGRGWVDHIRSKGNEAAHEIHLMTSADAAELISFAEMLLKFIFEFPARVPAKP